MLLLKLVVYCQHCMLCVQIKGGFHSIKMDLLILPACISIEISHVNASEVFVPELVLQQS